MVMLVKRPGPTGRFAHSPGQPGRVLEHEKWQHRCRRAELGKGGIRPPPAMARAVGWKGSRRHSGTLHRSIGAALVTPVQRRRPLRRVEWIHPLPDQKGAATCPQLWRSPASSVATPTKSTAVPAGRPGKRGVLQLPPAHVTEAGVALRKSGRSPSPSSWLNRRNPTFVVARG